MAGRGTPPKADRVRRADPIRGELTVADGECWSGPVPDVPEGLMSASQEAWATWFSAWFSAHWTPADLPALRQLIRLYDQVERGEFQRAAEMRLQMDTYGITPKGQQDRRWVKPTPADPGVGEAPKGKRYGHLRSTG